MIGLGAPAARDTWISMKPQQRKFVVEVKSARRRSAVRPASIWGDTDLKALVRAAESEAPHLFATIGQAAEVAAPQSAGDCNQDRETVAEAVPIAASPAVSKEAAALPAYSEETPGASPNADRQITVSQTQKRPRRMPPTSKTLAPAAPVAVDGLAALEEENRRLKGLLARRLRQENALLRKMLERFGAN